MATLQNALQISPEVVDQVPLKTLRDMVDGCGIALYCTTPDGAYLTANNSMARLFGYDDAEHLLGAVTDVGAMSWADPTDRVRFLEAFDRSDSIRDFVSLSRRRDGSLFWVSENATAVRNPDGTLRYFVGSMIDVGARIEAEKALGEAQAIYREMFEHATMGIFRTSPYGELEDANPAVAAFHGFDTVEQLFEAIGRLPPERRVVEDWFVDAERHESLRRRLFSDKIVKGVVAQLRRLRTQETFWASINMRVVHDDDGNAVRIEGSIDDITERKEAEAALIKAMATSESLVQAKNEFLATMSHELRTPLNAIIGFAEMMAHEQFGPHASPQYQQYADYILDSGNHLLRLIEDVLDVAKAEAGRLDIEEQPIDLVHTLVSCCQMLRPRAAKKSVSIEALAITGIPYLYADRTRLRQVLLNLLSNAVKFTDSGGTVEAEAGLTADREIYVRICDNGIGMSEADVRRIGQPFVKLTRGGQRVNEGTGLGLYLSRVIAELHGGDLVISSAVGQGTTVTVTFPEWRTLTDTDHRSRGLPY